MADFWGVCFGVPAGIKYQDGAEYAPPLDEAFELIVSRAGTHEICRAAVLFLVCLATFSLFCFMRQGDLQLTYFCRFSVYCLQIRILMQCTSSLRVCSCLIAGLLSTPLICFAPGNFPASRPGTTLDPPGPGLSGGILMAVVPENSIFSTIRRKCVPHSQEQRGRR